jgi:hypothetical protein
LTAGIGAGGLLALYLSFRRQRVSEEDHLPQSRVAANTSLTRPKSASRSYTAERSTSSRTTSRPPGSPRLRARALGPDKPRPSPNHRRPDLRYLRIRSELAGPDAPPNAQAELAPNRNEAEVRAAAQKILLAHLNEDDAERSGPASASISMGAAGRLFLV